MSRKVAHQVEVTWEDAYVDRHDGERFLTEALLDYKPALVKQTGYFIDRNSKVLVLAFSVAESIGGGELLCRDRMFIPASLIRKVRKLK